MANSLILACKPVFQLAKVKSEKVCEIAHKTARNKARLLALATLSDMGTYLQTGVPLGIALKPIYIGTVRCQKR